MTTVQFLRAKALIAGNLKSCSQIVVTHLLKTYPPGEMLVAVREVLRGKLNMSRGLSRDAIDCLRWQHKKLGKEDERLTGRQREVLQLLAEGKVMKEVSGILKHVDPGGCVSQVPDDGSAWCQEQRRTGQICR